MMKAKSRNSRLKLGLPSVILFCSLFFFAGLFVSALFFQDFSDVKPRYRERMLEDSVVEMGYDVLEHGQTGENFVQSIPFQIIELVTRKRRSWYKVVYWKRGSVISVELSNHYLRLQPSQLALRKGESAASTKNTRTSSGTFISASQDKTGILDLIERKIARVTMLPRTHGEAFNVLRYELGQKYDAHYDAFNPVEYGPQQSQRVASFLLYLSNVEVGGETMFPYEHGMNMNTHYDFRKCTGLKVKPRQGDGLLFYSLLPNGTIDKTSLHGSCPVIEGEKWVATKWIRDQGPK